jgi:serine/threonine protein kinase
VAVKVEEPNSQIKNDQMVWNKLLEHEQGGFRGLAKFFDYVPAYKKRTQCFMVTERLGPSLDALRNGSRRFAASAIPAVAHQALCMLREVHVRGFVHRDVKPANFLVGISNREQTLHLVDFGTSEPYLPLIQKQDRSGTLSYLPRGALLKQPLSRRDDLEGLCYTLLSLMAGSLPWQAEAIAANKLKGKKYEAANINLGNSRESAALKLAYELQPPNVSIMVVALLEYVYGLSPNEDPDYDLLLRHCSDASANAASNIGGQMTVGFMPLPDLSLLVTTQNKADPGLRFENSAEIPTEDGGHSNPRGQPLGDSWICSGAQDLEELGEMTYRDLQRVAKQVGVPANQNRVRLEAALAREREV